ncbi:glycosyltransferase [bacterium]|nr:glycosyltransferase [bacterium]
MTEINKQMDISVIPFHDWRKIQQEGSRTRDAHIIEHLGLCPDINKVVVINRPITPAEMIYRKTNWKTKGQVVNKGRFSQLVQLSEKMYVIDTLHLNPLPQLIEGKRWFFSAFGEKHFIDEVKYHIDALGFQKPTIISFNIFAAELCKKLNVGRCLFDAWDNFMRFPQYGHMSRLIKQNYLIYSDISKIWTTNSEKNRQDFMNEFNVKNCEVVRNGVDVEKFKMKYPIPNDLIKIKRPIVGFGGKITHLVDADLLNIVVKSNADKSFVIIGQILDKEKFNAIKPQANLFYLGDKHYDLYPAYVTNFDVCILPYVVGNKEHGQDSIKIYEYIAAGKPTVTTNVNGINDLNKYVSIANDASQFSSLIDKKLADIRPLFEIPEEFSWARKTRLLINHVKAVYE